MSSDNPPPVTKQNRPIGALKSDYDEGAQCGSYEFGDRRAGYRDGARVLQDTVYVFTDESADIDNWMLRLLRRTWTPSAASTPGR